MKFPATIDSIMDDRALCWRGAGAASALDMCVRRVCLSLELSACLLVCLSACRLCFSTGGDGGGGCQYGSAGERVWVQCKTARLQDEEASGTRERELQA